MNLTRTYYYFFSSIYSWYIKKGEKQNPGFTTICVITLLQTMNLCFFFSAYGLIANVEWHSIKKLYIYLIFFCLWGLNYYWIYKKVGTKKILNEYKEIKTAEGLNKKYFRISFSYSLLTIISFILITILANTKK